ncbi:hypothetical protein BST17_12565 [Mycolicibacterium bacteremicum]|uniref:Uncharacterized protein n=1 Tax=Mycolicibacterium bacteremicum TaxID=564198 RepID=A0A1W9YWU4_MYCBA|nr:hypothetical protein BST17_12565 [Mycolicibacterium bacteremicum]
MLLVSGVAVNAWALFPSAVESGVYLPFAQGPPPVAAEANPVRDAGGDLSVSTSRISFRLMDTARMPAVPARYGSFSQASAALAVSMVPLRSKLQALLMLLYSRYGHDVDVAALELKLQALLRLPDSLLAQLIQHPDLADLAHVLDAVFLHSNDLSGIRTELDKIDISSTAGPIEQVDVVTINGRQAYIVYSPMVPPAAENISVTTTSVVMQRPVEFAVVVQIVTPAAEMTAFSFAPAAETFTAIPEQADPILAEFVAPPSIEPVATAEPSFAMIEVFDEPTHAPQPEFEDAVDPDDPFESDDQSEEQGDPFSAPGEVDTTTAHDDPPIAEQNEPEAADEPAGAHDDDGGESSSAEPSP